MQDGYSSSVCWRTSGTWATRVLAGLLAMAVCVPAAEAQSLAEVARREAVRRKAFEADAKVYTNHDLGPGSIRPPGPVAAAETPPEAAPATAAEPEAKAEVKDEEYWRGRITQARETMARAEIMRSALESRINALQTDFVNRDDPAQRAVIAQNRQEAVDELSRTTAEIEELKKEIADIQEEARKAGVPPGWVR